MYYPKNELDGKYNNNNHNKADKSKPINSTVCIFWLNGQCKNDTNCNFLHENIPEKYPECPYGISCTKKDKGCILKHTVKAQKECNAYKLGYCVHGKQCKNCHIEQELCLNYLLGFCPEGPNCKKYHFKTMITTGHDDLNYLSRSFPKIEEEK